MRLQLRLAMIYTFVVLTISSVMANEMTIANQFSIFQGLENQNVYEDIITEIENISNHIELCRHEDESNSELLEFYNSRGIRYFSLGLLEHALNDFDHVLDVLHYNQRISGSLFSLALWGRMLCHAYQNLEKETLQDLDLFQAYCLSECLPCNNSKTNIISPSTKNNHLGPQSLSVVLNNFSSPCFMNVQDEYQNNRYFIRPIAEFTNPNERISSSECKERVKGTADIMRLIITRIPNTSLVAAINFAICKIENVMCDCCDRNHWTECLTPIIEAYQYMKKCMDKGAEIAPKIIWPGR